MHLILRPLLRYADFSGRASRAEYWLFGLFQSLLFIVLLFMAFLAFTGIVTNPTQALGGVLLWLGIIVLVALGLFIPNLAVLARRMHDINLSAWWMGLLVPNYLAQGSNFKTISDMVNAAMQGGGEMAMRQAITNHSAHLSFWTLLSMLSSLVLFVIVLIPGNKGPNRFGGDPKDGSASPSRPTKPAFDEARIDAAIADLKAEKPHTPVFDFGPGSQDKPMIASRSASMPQAPSHNAPIGQSTAKPTFGRRR